MEKVRSELVKRCVADTTTTNPHKNTRKWDTRDTQDYRLLEANLNKQTAEHTLEGGENNRVT